MSNGLKYVRHSTVGFMTWPVRHPGLSHKEVAQIMSHGHVGRQGVILSAGFVALDETGLPLCMGRSETLDLDSMESDTDALRAEWGMSPTAPAQELA